MSGVSQVQEAGFVRSMSLIRNRRTNAKRPRSPNAYYYMPRLLSITFRVVTPASRKLVTWCWFRITTTTTSSITKPCYPEVEVSLIPNPVRQTQTPADPNRSNRLINTVQNGALLHHFERFSKAVFKPSAILTVRKTAQKFFVQIKV